jgi:uncharacterized protein YfaS (alpha-2-macroglobulin family)
MRNDKPRALAIALSLALLSLWPDLVLAAPPAPRVAEFSPQGTVKEVRQVTARFSEPMVALGDPRPAMSPFLIECAEEGTGRWIDSRNWAYDFDRDLPGGLRCRFLLRPGLKSLAGKPAAGQSNFAFSTGGPAVVSSVPPEGSEDVEEEQAFVLQLDAPVATAVIEAHVWFQVEGLPERIGPRIVTGPERETILKAVPHIEPSETVVVLAARQRFPSATNVSLLWSKAVASASGVTSDKDQVLEFKTRNAFSARFYCERTHANADCIPFTPMKVIFSAPVSRGQAAGIALVGPQGERWPAEIPAEEGGAEHVEQVEVKGPFPERSLLRLELPPDLRDDAGRALLNAADFPLTVKTEDFPPLAKFSSRFGIIEAAVEPVLPVTLRNLEPEIEAQLLRLTAQEDGGGTPASTPVTASVVRVEAARAQDFLPWLRRVGEARRAVSVFAEDGGPPASAKRFTVPKPNGAKAFEVVGLPLPGPGLYVVELASPRLGASLLGRPQAMYVPAAALVTNLAVHFKWGRENAVAWVTRLDDARPVAEAEMAVQDCHGTVLWSGTTGVDGLARIEGLPERRSVPVCPRVLRTEEEDETEYYYDDSSHTRALSFMYEGLLVSARAGDDLSFTHSEWVRGIEPWRFQLPLESYLGPLAAHTILDRSLFRAGETVHMKHLVRLQSLGGFAPVPGDQRPDLAVIRHQGSDEKFELPVTWDASGSATNEWTIPKTAKLGTYEVLLTRRESQSFRDQRTSGRFRVEEFRVPLAKAIVRLPTEPQVAVTSVPADVSIQYLAGGAAANLPVVLRALIRPKAFQPGWERERFTFANGSVRPGIVRSGAAQDEEAGDTATRASSKVHQRTELKLDGAGAARAEITDIPEATALRELLAEVEFRDPNGETQTVASTVPLWPADWLVGIRAEEWASSREQLKARIAVVDRGGRPVGGAPVRVETFPQKTYSHRKRLVGGFYAYEHVTEVGASLGVLCEGHTDAAGLFICEGSAPADGNLILQAATTDGGGRSSFANGEVWVAGPGQWWFQSEDSDRIDVLPEKSRYEPGETARLQVRMPFREATALVSIEREGVIEARVQPLTGKEPLIEIPVTGAYAPNVFVSVLAVRGRAGEPQPTALVDLGKPAFKLGVAELAVGWRAHEIEVEVSAERPAYRVREQATVRIEARAADGTPLAPGSEAAVAAVDEGLLELQANPSWDLLPALMARRGYGVRTATAQMHVVGKRHFGLKAVPQGGGGGRQTTRELFDTLLYWNARVPLDAGGRAVVTFPLNDALTSFRIVAVATSGLGQFGTGATTIRSTQDLMLLSGLAPMVREGDEIASEITVRNTTERSMDVEVRAGVAELPAPLPARTEHLGPGEAKVLEWQISVPPGVERLTYEVEARESGGAGDHLRVVQSVRPAVPVRTLQATLFRWEKPAEEPVERPADALPGRGGVEVRFAPSLSGGNEAARNWIGAYPYTCLEQRVSRAVILRDEQLWNDLAAGMPSYLDGDGLLKYFPTMSSGSDVLTAYVLAIAHAARLPLPSALEAKMQDGLRRFVSGSISRTPAVPAADLPLRKLAALSALSRAGGAEPKLLGTIETEPKLWPTSAVLDWWHILRRVPYVHDHKAKLRAAERIVRARLNLQGTTMGFSTERGDAFPWMLLCPDTNSVRLIFDLLEAELWREDLPRLMRGALGRQRRGVWDCTVSNAWGSLAVERFSQVFEAKPVAGASSATLGDRVERLDWTEQSAGGVLAFAWPEQRRPVRMTHEGSGNPWVTVQTRAAIPLREPLSSGYRISKTVTPVETREPGRLARGDVVRVRLEVEAQADMSWVVVDDPVPAGTSHLGTGLGRDSGIASQESADDRRRPDFVERAFDAYRAYYEYIPKGRFRAEYTIRLNQSGTFQLPPTRVEALYAPEMFGEIPNAPVEVGP